MARSRYRATWSPGAFRDVLDIAEFVGRRSPQAARKIRDELRRRADSLVTEPRRGRVVPELDEQGISTLRELILGPYRLVYRVDDSEVLVLLVFDGRRNAEDVLYNRLVRRN